MEKVIHNDKGEPVKLTNKEIQNAKFLEGQIQNALGLEVDITTMTAIYKSMVEQKFFQINIFDYLPVVVGNGAYSSQITTYRSFNAAEDFEAGLVNTATGNTRLIDTDSGVDAVTVSTAYWASTNTWNILELAQAQRASQLFDLISAKEKARKKAWDLGIQRTAFLGSRSNSTVKGLLTQSDVNSNTSIITKKISSMSDAEFQTFVAAIVEAYRSNAARTTYPTHFIIPEGDWNGLVTPANTNFAITSKLEYLEKAFKTVTMNPNFKILPLAYADSANNSDVSGLNKNRYTLLNMDADSIRMDIPVQYTNTQQNSVNGFNFQNVGYGQFTGAKAYRPLETLYFDY